MFSQLRNPKFYLMLASDAAIFILAHMLAYLVRFDFGISPARMSQVWGALAYLIPLKIVIFSAFGLYRGMWRYTSLRDVRRMAEASLVSVLLYVAILRYFGHFLYFSRAVFLLDGLFTFVLCGALRAAIRWYYEARMSASNPGGEAPKARADRRRLLIIGAGDAGEKLLREIAGNPRLRYTVSGLLDDDPRKEGRSLHGVPILGPSGRLPEVVKKHRVEEVFIAMPSASGADMRRVVEICKAAGVSYKTVPGMGEIVGGSVSVKTLRDVNYQDLLGRPAVRLDTEGISEYLTERVVLVTGCGGSIGSELSRQVARFHPARLVLVDASEANLFHIQMELHHEFGFRAYHTVLGAVQDRALMEAVFARYKPSVVFHAAAYKHVPMMEINPWEAVMNNIHGSQVVMETAAAAGVERFVLVSTDKAVRPTNVMGASKRAAELILRSMQGGATRFMAVRFGNVVGSSGSVIPLFRRQIEQGGPVTVTHADVTRYFMTIPEAAQLILQAGALGEGGEVFVLEMGTPVRIADMARDLIRLSGKEPGKDIEIVFTGLRDGEKLHEELITAGEDIARTAHEKIMVLRAEGLPGGPGTPEEIHARLATALPGLYALAGAHNGPCIKAKLHEIVPEYAVQETACVL